MSYTIPVFIRAWCMHVYIYYTCFDKSMMYVCVHILYLFWQGGCSGSFSGFLCIRHLQTHIPTWSKLILYSFNTVLYSFCSHCILILYISVCRSSKHRKPEMTVGIFVQVIHNYFILSRQSLHTLFTVILYSFCSHFIVLYSHFVVICSHLMPIYSHFIAIYSYVIVIVVALFLHIGHLPTHKHLQPCYTPWKSFIVCVYSFSVKL